MSTSLSYYDALYSVKRNFLIIGLTGYTASGCSTCRDILANEIKPSLPEFEYIPEYCKSISQKREKKIYEKLRRTWESPDWKWKKFIPIEIANVIFMFLIHRVSSIETPNDYQLSIKQIVKDIDQNTIERISLLWEDIEKHKYTEIIPLFEKTSEYYNQHKKLFSDKDKIGFIERMQNYGDEIRRYGKITFGDESPAAEPKNLFILPEAIRRIIKGYELQLKAQSSGPCHFVIDAFRNPFEVEFFKGRYNEFYLIGLLRSEKERKDTLGFSNSDFIKLNNREKCVKLNSDGKRIKRTRDNIHDWINTQNIDECLQRADIYIENRNDDSKTFPALRYNLVKLISLIKNPGCIPPTRDEKNMQLAMTARLMSGCISRQVGAVVVDKKGFVAGIGWNDAPSGQVPCSLRTTKQLCDGGNAESFSEYERSAEFVTQIKNKYSTSVPFCFKTEYESIKKEKKTEFTRAIHAEENALFQASRTTGDLNNSTLYTSSRTCTLCAKKAYQLGVKRIVYIEDYTDDAIIQTLKIGKRIIIVDRFQGIIGAAFFKLYSTILPEKDIIKLFYNRNP